MTLEKGLSAFLDALLGKNRSAATLRAYRTDILQLIAFLHENNVAITNVGDVEKVDVLEYLAALARKGLSGIARARKVSAIREYFRFLEGVGVIHKSPTTGIDTPKREKHTRQFLRPDEYTKMLSLAGAHPRDYAILQTFLQRVHYVILTRRPLEDSTVVGWQEKIVDQPTCGGVPHGRGSHYLL